MSYFNQTTIFGIHVVVAAYFAWLAWMIISGRRIPTAVGWFLAVLVVGLLSAQGYFLYLAERKKDDNWMHLYGEEIPN